MSVKTAVELIKEIQNNYNPDDVLMYTYWSITDIDDLVPESADKEDIWERVVEQADYSLDEGVALTNRVICAIVEELLEEEETNV